MTNVILRDNLSQAEFERQLNQATGYRENFLTPAIKFNAETGQFLLTDGTKGEDGKPVYQEIQSNSIDVHIIRYRKMVMSDRKAKKQYFSREFDGDIVNLINPENAEDKLTGTYKELKAENEHLTFVQVLYLYFDGKPYRMKLSGSKLPNWFDYIKESNPALYITEFSKGQTLKNGSVTYYEMGIARKDRLDIKTITERVNAINAYISSYEGKRDNVQVLPENTVTDIADEASDDFKEPEGNEEIDTSLIPF